MARWITAVLSLAIATSASGQTTTTSGNGVTVRETNDTDNFINIAECQGVEQDGLIFNWTVPNFTAGGTFQLIASDQSGCPTGSGTTAHNITIADNISATSASGSFPANGNVAVQSLLGQLQINCNGSATAVFFCVNFTGTGLTPGTASATGSIQLDLTLPAKPLINTPITPGDGALNVSWSPGTTPSAGTTTIGTSSNYRIVVTSQTNPADTRFQDVFGTTSGRVSGLQNGVTYNVQVFAFSPGDNQSDGSDTVPGTPQIVEDFWRLYQAAGGRETGGCGAGDGGIPALLGVLPLVWRRRRSS